VLATSLAKQQRNKLKNSEPAEDLPNSAMPACSLLARSECTNQFDLRRWSDSCMLQQRHSHLLNAPDGRGSTEERWNEENGGHV
jgi:hypothetical protein